MKTDALFYQLFQTLPDLFFELTGLTYSESYQFQSVELKQTAFRLDGVFVPQQIDLPLIFVEVQFQKDDSFYGRFFSEIMLYLYQHKPKQTVWQAVAIFPNRAVDTGKLTHYQGLLPYLQRIYLDEVLPRNQPSALNLFGMIISHANKAIEIAKDLLLQPFYNEKEREFLLSSIETILVYKLPGVPREEIRKMINLAHVDITRTSWYQEGKENGIQLGRVEGRFDGMKLGKELGIEIGKQEGKWEGKQEEAQSLVMRLLSKRFGKLTKTVAKKIERLSLQELEMLADDFFQFESVKDLQVWLKTKV